jgi:hypothetical protein
MGQVIKTTMAPIDLPCQSQDAIEWQVVVRFESGTRILRVIHRQDARATSPNCISTRMVRQARCLITKPTRRGKPVAS